MEKIKVLIPTDFSVQAEYAYLLVKRLAEKAEMDVHFLHVLNVPDTVTMDAQGTISTCGEIDVNFVKTQKDIAERKLENLRNLHGAQLSVHLIFGKTTTGITQFAEKNAYDLIVMGTHGAVGLKERISGSETQMVARASKVPVLSLMCDRSELEVHKVLLVHDFAQAECEDLRVLHRLIQAFGIEVHFLQIVRTDKPATVQQVEADMQRFAELNKIGKYIAHTIQDTDVEHGVVHFTQMHDMDMICIGTHGRGGWLHHSATEKLINHMHKPLISFPLKNHKA